MDADCLKNKHTGSREMLYANTLGAEGTRRSPKALFSFSVLDSFTEGLNCSMVYLLPDRTTICSDLPRHVLGCRALWPFGLSFLYQRFSSPLSDEGCQFRG